MTDSRLTTGTDDSETVVSIPASELRDGDQVLASFSGPRLVEHTWRSTDDRQIAGVLTTVETVRARLTGMEMVQGWDLDETLTVVRIAGQDSPRVENVGIGDTVWPAHHSRPKTVDSIDHTPIAVVLRFTDRTRASFPAWHHVLRTAVAETNTEDAPASIDRPQPATEPVLVVQADPEPQGYTIPSPEETAAHRAAQAEPRFVTHRADDPAAAPNVGTFESEQVRADQVRTDDVLLQGQRLAIRRPVTGIARTDDGHVLIRYGSGYTLRSAAATITIQRRTRRAPSTVVVRHPVGQLPPMPPEFANVAAFENLLMDHPELRPGGFRFGHRNEFNIQVSGSPAASASALLAWFYRLTDTTVTVQDYPHSSYSWTGIKVTGRHGALKVEAWFSVPDDQRAAVLASQASVHLLRDIAVNGLVSA